MATYVSIIVVSALSIQLFLLIMHFHHHFKLQLFTHILSSPNASFSSIQQSTFVNTVSNDNITKVMETQVTKRKCDCRFKSKNETFGFFPSSFCCYIAFNIVLYIILITRLFTNCHINLVDYILFYGVMITYVWESLFAYYRYYTTKLSAIQFSSASITTILTKFLLYITVYLIISCIYMHIFYYIFPLLILLHSISNVYCNYTFAHILIKRYTIFLKLSEFSSDLNSQNQQNDKDILHSIHLMRKISLLANTFSIISLTIFLYSNQIATLYYVCIISSISSFIFSVNFIRNRKYILRCFDCNKNEPVLTMTDVITDTATMQKTYNPNNEQINPSPEKKENKNKHNYDRFNALVGTLNDERMDKHNPIIPLRKTISDVTYNKNPKSLKPKYNSNPVNSTHIQTQQQYDTSTDSKSHEIIFEDSDCEVTPAPINYNIKISTFSKTETFNSLELKKHGVKSNPVGFKEKHLDSNVVKPVCTHTHALRVPKQLINHKSAPHTRGNERNVTYMNSIDFDNEIDEKQLRVPNVHKPRLNPFNISNSISAMSTIETIRKKLKFSIRMEKDNDFLIDEKEDIVSNIDELMANSFSILAKDGFYSTKRLKITHGNNRGNTQMSQQRNVGRSSFLKSPIAFIRQNSV